jgi:hypothetical protein
MCGGRGEICASLLVSVGIEGVAELFNLLVQRLILALEFLVIRHKAVNTFGPAALWLALRCAEKEANEEGGGEGCGENQRSHGIGLRKRGRRAAWLKR